MNNFERKFSQLVVTFILKLIKKCGYSCNIINPNLTVEDLVSYNFIRKRQFELTQLPAHPNIKGKNLEKMIQLWRYKHFSMGAWIIPMNPNLTKKNDTKI